MKINIPLLILIILTLSFLEQDEKDIVKIPKRSRGIYIFILFLCRKFEKVGLKSHKFKLFNPIDILTKTKY